MACRVVKNALHFIEHGANAEALQGLAVRSFA